MIKCLISVLFMSFVSFSCLAFYFLVSKERQNLPEIAVDWKSLSHIDSRLLSGRVNFEQRCNKCHGKYGYVNNKKLRLNDNIWFNGSGDLDFIYSVISNGINEKGMRGWKHKLLRDDLINLSLYVKSLSKN